MSRVLRVGVVVAAAAALLGAAGTPVGTKKVSDEKYAKTLCTTLKDLKDTQGGLVDQYNALGVADPPGFQSQAAGLVEGYLSEVKSAAAKLKKLEPDVGGGKKIARAFTAYINGVANEVQAALDTFRAANPGSPAFAGDITAFETSINVLGTTLGDPFSKVKNQELLGAFDKERSCDEVVQVVGA
jgi:gas vesicle protein